MKIISLIGDKHEALPFITSKMDRKVCTIKRNIHLKILYLSSAHCEYVHSPRQIYFAKLRDHAIPFSLDQTASLYSLFTFTI